MTGAIETLSIAAIALPLALAAMISVRASRPVALRVAPWATLPALIAAFGGREPATVHSDTLVLGTSIGVDHVVTRAFLVLTATVWLASGWFARAYMADDPRRARFWLFFLVAAAGNVGLVLAGDVATFYLFYAVMTFAAYGVVVHAQDAAARRAAAVYLVMALVGEMLLLAGFVLLVGVEIDLPLRAAPRAVAVAPDRDLVVGLLLAGFGIKAGALVLHVWLPLAHPVAPTPASAVLSGAMIKAGLLGWLRFLPLGVAALPDAGRVCLVAGFAAVFYGVAVGLVQRDAKTILAYSSVSQMGFVTAALGVALATPATAAIAVSTILFYALHHALTKAALFLGAGVAIATRAGWRRHLVVLGLVVSALALAGAPLTGGALAKISLAQLVTEGSAAPGALLSAGAVGTTLLMARLLAVVVRRRGTAAPCRGLWMPWLVLLVLDAVLPVWSPIDHAPAARLIEPANVASAAWPVMVGLAAAMVARRTRSERRRVPRIPPGDLLVIFELAYRSLRRLLAGSVLAAARGSARLQAAWEARGTARKRRREALVRAASWIEEALSTFAAVVAALLLLGILLARAADR